MQKSAVIAVTQKSNFMRATWEVESYCQLMDDGARTHPSYAGSREALSPHGAARRGILFTLALIVLTFVAYWPAIQEGGFIWDDDDYVTANKTLRDIDGLKDIWTSPQATPQYYPLVHTGYWIEYRLWGLDPTGYHVTNVLLHALVSVLLWRLLRWLAVPGAWLVAGLFALHPVHVESVAWITERKNVLSGVFYLAAALVYLKWADAKAAGQRKPGAYFGALLFFVCALLSKTVTVSLPAALLLVAWWRQGRDENPKEAEQSPIRWWRARILPLVPFFVIGLVFSVITIWLEKYHVGAKGAEWDLSLIERCLIAGRVLWFYIGKLLWPVGLSFNYPRWEIDAGVWWQYLFPLGFAALVILLWVGRKRLGRGPLVAMLFFAGSLFPALGFFDVYPMRYSFVADHFQYLANIGVLVLVAAVITSIGQRLGAGAWKPASHVLPALLLVLLALGSWKQCGIYRGLEVLWLDTIAKNPASWMAYNNLGQLYLHENRVEEAVPLFEKSIFHNPRDPGAPNNLGVALGKLGRDDEAKARFQQAMKADPLDPQAYHNLGVAMAKEGRREEAIGFYRKALEINPELAATHVNLGMTLAQMGRNKEAIEEFGKAVAIDPETGLFHQSYADALMAAGRVREAADRYRTAVSLDPLLAAAHYQLGRIAMADQLLPAALEHFRDAVGQAPDFAMAHSSLAVVLSAIGRHEAAAGSFRTALSLAPESGPIRLEHANFLVSRGDPQAARAEFLKAAERMPDDPTPLFQLGVLEQKLGDMAAAEARFRSVLKQREHGPACNHLAVLLAGQGKNQEAVEMLRRAVKTESGDAEYFNNLGVMLVRSGSHEEALKALEEAVRLNPGYAEARKNLEDLRRLISSKQKP